MQMGKKCKLALAVGMIAAVVTGVVGCGSSNSNNDKVIRVGAETTFPPFEFVENEKYVGFDLDLADAFQHKSDVWKNVHFVQRVPILLLKI